MQAALHGSITGKSGPSKRVAREFIEKTPAKKRRMFTKALMHKRGKFDKE
jgi:hypothetical protein